MSHLSIETYVILRNPIGREEEKENPLLPPHIYACIGGPFLSSATLLPHCPLSPWLVSPSWEEQKKNEEGGGRR